MALCLNPVATSESFQVCNDVHNENKETIKGQKENVLESLNRDSVAVTGGRTLQILNAKQEDAGRYTCVATNEAGETLKHYEVKVYGETPSALGACCSIKCFMCVQF